jgi:hypothetical protein
MSPRKSRCDVPNGTTQGWACLIFNVQQKINVVVNIFLFQAYGIIRFGGLYLFSQLS